MRRSGQARAGNLAMFIPKSTTPGVMIMTRTLKTAVAARCLAVMSAGAANAGDYED
jgi:hypothetical protein